MVETVLTTQWQQAFRALTAKLFWTEIIFSRRRSFVYTGNRLAA
jgi:hypothetical protein